MALDPGRRSQILSSALLAAARSRLGDPPGGWTVVDFAPGAAVVSGSAVCLFVEGDASRCVGPATAWARRLSPSVPVRIVATTGAGVAARRAAHLDADIAVWGPVGPDGCVPDVPPAPHAPVLAPPASHLALAPLITRAGAELVVEHAVVTGEARGLEVCRVVDDPDTGGARLEAGMGADDRAMFAMLNGHLPAEEALRGVVGTVAAHRHDVAPPHPFNLLAAERYMRWAALGDPSLVGCATLSAAEPPEPRTNLKDPVPCVASGTDAQGRRVAVTFARGVDLDAVPFALDAADRLGAQRAVLALRARDVTASVRALAALAKVPCEVVLTGP